MGNLTDALRQMVLSGEGGGRPSDVALWLSHAQGDVPLLASCAAKDAGPVWGAAVSATAALLTGLHILAHWGHSESLLYLIAACLISHGVGAALFAVHGTVRWARIDAQAAALACWLCGGLLFEELAERLAWVLEVHNFATAGSRAQQASARHLAATALRARMGALDAGHELTHLGALYRQQGAAQLAGESHVAMAARWGVWLARACFFVAAAASFFLADEHAAAAAAAAALPALLPLVAPLLCGAALLASELSCRAKLEAGGASLLKARLAHEFGFSEVQAARVLASWHTSLRRGRACLAAGLCLVALGGAWLLLGGPPCAAAWPPARGLALPARAAGRACVWLGVAHLLAWLVVARAERSGCVCAVRGGLGHSAAWLARRALGRAAPPRTRTKPSIDLGDLGDLEAAREATAADVGDGTGGGGGADGGSRVGGALELLWRPWLCVLPSLRPEAYACAARVPPLEILGGALRQQSALLAAQLRDADARERRAAVEAFCLLGASGRAAERAALDGAAERLLRALTDIEPGVRRAAVAALGMLSLGALEERHAALSLLHEHPDGAVRMAVAAALARVAAARQGRLVHSLLAQLAEADAHARLRALAGVASLPPRVIDEQCAERVLTLLDDGEWAVRAAAVQALGRLPLDALVLHTAPLLAHQSDGGREVLNRIPRDLALLLERCADADWTVRQAAVGAIGRLPPASLVLMPRVLLRMMDDSRVGVCSAAAAVLNKMQLDSPAVAEQIQLKLERLPKDGELRAQLLNKLPAKAAPASAPPADPSAQRL